MTTGNPGREVLDFVRQFVSNQVARLAPGIYTGLTHRTGRGDDGEDPALVAEYFIHCFRDYQEQLGLDDAGISDFLDDKVVLEYGPGDTLCMALLMYAHGARRVCCIDRFPLSGFSARNVIIYRHLLNALPAPARQRASTAFIRDGIVASGFDPAAIAYQAVKNGLSGAQGEYDLIISRAVLEHVNNLEETMRDIKQALKPGGISLHKVDLKSHGLDRQTDFDFLTRPEVLYKLMYSHKGYPNRWRVNKYRELAASTGLRLKRLTPTGRLSPAKLRAIYRRAAGRFGTISPDEFSWLGFWMLLEHP